MNPDSQEVAMRRFEDAQGRAWDVVLGRESWGVLYALFVPAGHQAPIRQALLRAEGYDAAQTELATLDESALMRLFEQSSVKET
jgi:hypothetical protein